MNSDTVKAVDPKAKEVRALMDMHSDAYAAGLQAGDMIVSINGAQIESEEDIQAQTKNLKVGDTVSMVIRRSGRDYKVDIKLSEYKG